MIHRPRQLLTVSALVVSVLALAGCASSPEPLAVEDFIQGTWECGAIDETPERSMEMTVSVDGPAVNVMNDDGRKLFTYEVSSEGLTTSPEAGSGWKIEMPLEVTPGKDFRIFIESLDGEGTDEEPTISFKDDAVVIDSIYERVLSCEKVSKNPTDPDPTDLPCNSDSYENLMDRLNESGDVTNREEELAWRAEYCDGAEVEDYYK